MLKCWTADGSDVKASPPLNGGTDYQEENKKFGTWITGLNIDTQYNCTVEASNSLGRTVAPVHVGLYTQHINATKKFGESTYMY